MAPVVASSIRAEVCAEVLDRIAKSITDEVSITFGYPGDARGEHNVWLLAPIGTVDHSLIASQVLPADDTFTFTVFAEARKLGMSDRDAMFAAQRLGNAVFAAMSPVRDNGPTVGDLELGNSFVMQALISRWDGPHVEVATEGWRGYVSIEITAHTRTSHSPN